MKTRTKVFLSILALLTAFAFGRYSTPDYRKTEKESSETDSGTKTKDKDTSTHEESETEEETLPDGTKRKKTKTVKDTNRKSAEKEEDSKSKTSKETEEVIKGSKVTVSALAAYSLSSFNPQAPSYGVSISKPVLGPITLGAFYLSPSVLGLSLGLTF